MSLRPSRRPRRAAVAAAALLLAAPALAAAAAGWATSFEFADATGSFTVGSAPLRATFDGGESSQAGGAALAHSGSFSWRVAAGTGATIQLETPASAIELFVRNSTPDTRSAVKVLGVSGRTLAVFRPSDKGWGRVRTTPFQERVAAVRLDNRGGSGELLVDDFGLQVLRGGAE